MTAQLVVRDTSTWVRAIARRFVTFSVVDADDRPVRTLQWTALGADATISIMSTARSLVRRTPRDILEDGSDDVLVLFPLSHPVVVRENGVQQHLMPGAMAVHAADTPYELEFPQSGNVLVYQARRRVVDDASLLTVRHRRAVAEAAPAVAEVFRAFAYETLRAAGRMNGQEREAMGASAAHLLTTALRAVERPEYEAVPGPPAIVVSAMAFISAHLDSPALTPTNVAGHLHVSLRSLQTSFERVGTSPARYIRDQRLDRARQLLHDPRHDRFPISYIGVLAGYDDTASFIRAYRRRYSITPGAVRADNRHTHRA